MSLCLKAKTETDVLIRNSEKGGMGSSFNNSFYNRNRDISLFIQKFKNSVFQNHRDISNFNSDISISNSLKAEYEFIRLAIV